MRPGVGLSAAVQGHGSVDWQRLFVSLRLTSSSSSLLHNASRRIGFIQEMEMKSVLKLLVGGLVSGLLGSVAYISAGTDDGTAIQSDPKASLCEFRGVALSGVYVDCSRQAHGLPAVSMAQIFAGARR